VAAKKMVPPNKSCLKRLRQAEKANAANRSARSAIRTSLGIVRKAKSKEEKEVALKEVPRLFSMLDKAAAKRRAGFSKNRAANYKSKIGLLINKWASVPTAS
jgi:small subunit ribosomal protein S20